MKTEIYWAPDVPSSKSELYDLLVDQYAGHEQIDTLENVKPDSGLVLIGKLDAEKLEQITKDLNKDQVGGQEKTPIFMSDVPPFNNPAGAMLFLAQQTGRDVYFPLNKNYETEINSDKVTCTFHPSSNEESIFLKALAKDGLVIKMGKEFALDHSPQAKNIQGLLGAPNSSNRGDVPRPPSGVYHQMTSRTIESNARDAARFNDTAATRAAKRFPENDKSGKKKRGFFSKR